MPHPSSLIPHLSENRGRDFRVSLLVLILFPFLLLAPVLQGIWGLGTQFLLEAAVFLTGGFWFLREIRAGRLPSFISDRGNIPLLFALIFSLLASRLSPVSALIAPEWWNFLTGIFILALASSLTTSERKSADLALRLAAWFIVLLSFYQGYVIVVNGVGDSTHLTASLTNANALALFAVMVLPLTVLWRDFFLLAALVVVLIWTMSVAAVLGLLVGACFYAADNVKRVDLKKNWWVFAVLGAVAAAAVSQLELRSVSDRLLWWGSALRMFSDRPLLGFGQGAFTYIYPAFHHPDAARLASIYAHNYYLEFLAENGLPAFLFWGWAVLARLKGIKGLKKYALIAVLAHSFADFGLAVPANFFIFCYLLAEPGGFAVRLPGSVVAFRSLGGWSGKTLAAAALGVLLAAHLSGVVSRKMSLDRLQGSAVKACAGGDYSAAEKFLVEASEIEPDNPLVPQMLGQVLLRAGLEKNNRPALFRAAVSFERALSLNPYDAASYRDLGRLYAAAGERKMAEDLLKRKREVFRWER